MTQPPEQTAPSRLALAHVSKSFPGVKANQDISLAVRPGEIHALLGENGAGKSTLVKIIYGVQRADEGQVSFDGRPVEIASPKAARKLGIGMVFQHFSLFDGMTVLENIALGLDETVPAEELKARIKAILDSYSLPLDPDREVHTLSVGERQRIEIVRCLLQKPKLLIMDEPTSVLTPQEVERLFETLRQIAREGCSILYISHKLHEIKALCEAATILRAGRVVAACDPRIETTQHMAELMIGAELKHLQRPAASKQGAARLSVERLDMPGEPPFGTSLKGISFSAQAGEILGIAGVAGNGQAELLLALSGEHLASRNEAIKLDGRPIGLADAGARRSAGLACVPEERNGHAAVPDFSLAENVVLTARHRLPLAPSGLIRQGAVERYAGEVIARFDVRTTGPAALAGSLSGGNLQKFIMGREIGQRPDVLVVAQPTWGVDAGAAAAIRQALVDLAAQGSAIVVISQDLDELLELSDRLCVINEGRLSQARPVAGLKLEEIGLMMGGIHGESHEAEPAHA
ncbi:ABC transporter ATP-binding protein [Bosea sp. (in: a-proteobacteria)]|jgi:simple sugar transport system ATP-binding protein|uniref:ABC transporter ATP-binding protein n=1 Tax=Bosea sp. (in: a-proteobacteria) TaxID=1871050 RepID=UPI002DDD4B5B|nr:ABC transporter ATP-binding protein [Bosea sp. (in: a-proteobacteria)]HEV2513443.1 ABC transporter ATP-binding protein [Bosea sp. (in: a-proteobacteria)]